MSRRSVLAALALAAVIALSTSVASAEYRGTDLWSNLTPGEGTGGLADRYPLSHYQLDYYVDNVGVGLNGVDTSSVFPGLAHFFASMIFFAGATLMRLVIYVFDWAFNADLLTGGSGLLAPLSAVVKDNYDEVVLPFVVPAVIALGAWLSYKAVHREHKDVGPVLVRTLVFFTLSFVVAFHPAETIGRAYTMVDQLSKSVVSSGGGAQSVSDSLFTTFVYRPWAVLEFGGLQVCTGDAVDSDGFPLASTDSNPAKRCHSVLSKDHDGHGDYARRFARYAPGSKERRVEYEALRDGKVPDAFPPPNPSDCPRGDCTMTQTDQDRDDGAALARQFEDYHVDRSDSPAVDMMQADGALQRLAFSGVVFAGMLGGILLIGLLSAASLFAQIAVALLFVVSPFMILGAIIPSGHSLVENWSRLLGKALIGKFVYSVLLRTVLVTSAGLLTLGGTAGYLLAFSAQSLLYLGVFWKRKEIVAKVTSSKASKHYGQHENQAVSFAAGAATTSLAALTDGGSEVAQTMRAGWRGRSGSEGGEGAHQEGTSAPDTTSPPASAGREHSPGGSPSAPAETVPAGQAQGSQQQDNHNEGASVMPRPFREELERVQQQQSRAADATGEEPGADDPAEDDQPQTGGLVAASSRVATSQNFASELRRREAMDQVERGVGCEDLDLDALDSRYYDR